jgi:hypothetical protein
MEQKDFQTIRFAIERKKYKFLGIAERNSEYEIESMTVSLNAESEYFENIDESLYLRYNGKMQKHVKNQKISRDKRIIDGEILIDKNNICVRENYLTYPSVSEELPFTFKFKANWKSDEVKEHTFDKTISLKKQNAIPKISITKDERFFEKVTYQKNKFDFGYIVIKNVGKQYSYNLEVKDLKFKLINSNGDYILNEALNIKPREENADEFYKIEPGKEKKFKLELDISLLDNPDAKEKYVIEISGKKKLKDNDAFMPIDPNSDLGSNESYSFEIQENTTETDLVVSINLENEGKNREITNDTEGINLGSKNYDLDKGNDTKSIVQGYFGNRAKEGTANTDYIEIKEIKIEYSITPKDKKQDKEDFKSKIRKIIKNDFLKFDFIQNNWKKFSPNNNPILLRNKSNSLVKFKVYYKHSDFELLGDGMNSMDIKAILSFSYDIKDAEGRSKMASLGNVNTKTYIFDFNIRQHEGHEWLAIDFGTSAISAQYGNQDTNILDRGLKTQLMKIVENYDDVDYYEKDEFLLSSTIALKKARTDQSKRFHNSFVSLSPKKVSISNKEEFLLPYLKALVGYDKLPKFLLGLTKDSTFHKIINEEKVQNIIKETYHILLEDFVHPLFKTKRKNKIVLTIPNTFTSRHKNMLKEIVKVIMPDIWEDYTLFLSESDAVAWYYLNNEDSLLAKTGIDEHLLIKKKDVFKKKGQNVLVYDMGAGTLDLTLFRIENDQKSKKKIVSILGRSGQSTAGNYADYVLALEFWKQFQISEGNEDLGYHPVNNHPKDEAFDNVPYDYNLFIRDELKPFLNSPTNIKSREFYDQTYCFPDSIDINKITDSIPYKELLDKNSVQILNFLKSTFGIGDSFKIDTIVLSGRGVQLYGLEEALIKALKSVFKSEPLTIRIATDELKSIVSKGAIYYACKKDRPDIEYKPLPLDARYGIVTYHTGGNCQYCELLNPQSQFKDNIEFDDNPMSGYEATKKWKNLFNVDKLDIVQTYLCENDVKNALIYDTDKFSNSSTIIRSIFVENIDSSHYLQLVVDKDGEVLIKFDDDKTPPKVITINENIFKKTMYYLFNSHNNEN